MTIEHLRVLFGITVLYTTVAAFRLSTDNATTTTSTTTTPFPTTTEDTWCRRQLEVVVALDGSESISAKEFKNLTSSLKELVRLLHLGKEVRFGAVVYSSNIDDKAKLSYDVADLLDKIGNFTSARDGTRTDLGILEMIKMLEEDGHPGVPKVGIVITDGQSKDTNATLTAARQAKTKLKVEMFAMGIGDEINEDELNGIASSSDNVFKMVDVSELLSNIRPLVNKVCRVDGGWSEWTMYSGSCSVTCGTGSVLITWTRTCTNPPPSNDGRDCVGEGRATQLRRCHEGSCPVDCDGCRWRNGIGYKPYPGDCSKYIHCDTNKRATVRPCAPPLLWDQNLLNCNWPHLVPCSQTTQTTTTSAPTTTTVVMASCDGTKRPVPGDDSVYQENVAGFGWMVRDCPPGTVFNATICICDHGESTYRQECSAELYLPFDYDFNDYSGNQLRVQNEGVSLFFGRASFRDNAGLRVPRFSNMDFRSTLRIAFLLSVRFIGVSAQAVVSNADCGKPGSIYIVRSRYRIDFWVINEANRLHFISVPLFRGGYTSTPVSLTVDKGIMTASVGFQTRSTPFIGIIRRSQCALQIGRGFRFHNFVGTLDEFEVFLCVPQSEGEFGPQETWPGLA